MLDEYNSRAQKISKTFKVKKIDNFREWRKKNPILYPAFSQNEGFAEILGVVLGDGNIESFPRTERLVIAANSNNLGFVKRYSNLVKMLFLKSPTLLNSKTQDSTRISIYQKNISKLIGVPSGNRFSLVYRIPRWIWRNDVFLISYLRGLYEAEGSFCVHKPLQPIRCCLVIKMSRY